jgi:hypothetical protein
MLFNTPLACALLGILMLTLDLGNGCGCRSQEPVPVADSKEAAKVADQNEEAEIQANLAKLPAKDRKLAEEQKFCAVEEESRLGTMGVPVKVMIKDQPVFLCCKGCTKQAQKDPDKTLAKVKELKAKNKDKTSEQK